MTRPKFALSDDEARLLIVRLHAINDEHPLNQRDHRPFVRAFVRAVYEATRKTFSPTIYRRLLEAYAPDRRPSTATLAIEKQLLAEELELERVAATEVATADAPHLAALIRRAVADAIGERPVRAPFPAGAGAGPASDIAFWRERVADAERALADAQARAAHLAGELLAARTGADMLGAELASVRELLQSQTAQVGKLAAEIEESRRFSMRAIDDARGETRTWRDRCQVIETQAAARAREDNILLETFRQLAYQRGAAIPNKLQKGGQ